MVVRWPGRIKPGEVSDQLWYFPDVLPTLAELAGVEPPKNIDGISIVPTLLGEAAAGRKQQTHEFLYWEQGTSAAVRMGNWRAVLPQIHAEGPPRKNPKFELYDLDKDLGETTNVAAEHPEILAKMVEIARREHTPNVPGGWVEGKEDWGFQGHKIP